MILTNYEYQLLLHLKDEKVSPKKTPQKKGASKKVFEEVAGGRW